MNNGAEPDISTPCSSFILPTLNAKMGFSSKTIWAAEMAVSTQ